MQQPEKVNIAQKLSLFTEYWSPKIVSQYNDNDIMVVKIQGEFPWHMHPDTDDFFYVLEGAIVIETERGNVPLSAGEMYIVPKGVQHRPVAEKEAHVLLIEPKNTPNTGDVHTAVVKEQI